MTDVPEAATARLVADIVAAVRYEIADCMPVFLERLVVELKDQKPHSILDKDEVFDGICHLPEFIRNAETSTPKRTPPVPSTAVDRLCDEAFDAETSPPKRTPPVPSTACMSGMPETPFVLSTAFMSGLPEVNAESVSKAAEELTTAPSSPGVWVSMAPATPMASPSKIVGSGVPGGQHKTGCEHAMVGDRQSKNKPAALMGGSLPMKMEIAMSTPFVDHADPPEDCSQETLLCWLWRQLRFQRRFSVRGGFHLSPRYEKCSESVANHRATTSVKMEEEDGLEFADPEAVLRLPKEIAGLEEQKGHASETLQDLDALWRNRRKPYEEEIADVREEIMRLQEELELARMPRIPEPPPPGPATLKFIDSNAFVIVCNVVVCLNLIAMLIGPKFESYAGMFKAMDQIFLTWYVVELSAKALYYQRFLIVGKVSVVWWNWLDLGIVVSGIVDQWLLPLLVAVNGGHLDVDTSALRALRLLRLFRIMRFLKIAKAFLKSDFAWTEGAAFESWMGGVIAFNSVVMSIELDVPWVGWLYVENFLQVVYTFELACRVKRQCCRFFYDIDSMVWNYLDFLIVSGGALDLWLVPLITTLQGVFFDASHRNTKRSTALTDALRILKIMRILRVLRLVRLLKMVQPLYRLLMGVIASVKAMQWVVVLTFLMLYACSIVFTNLVGKGLMSGGEVSKSADELFGSVPKSLFSLFKLMNGDMSVVNPITDSISGQLLFACFMVVSNWAILAVLTAVVSDNMILASQKAAEEDEHLKNEAEYQNRIRRLRTLFQEIDRDGEGTISTLEWRRMLEDRSLFHELCDASGLQQDDLNDYFDCLAKDPKLKQQERDKLNENMCLDYHTFMDALRDEGALADKRSILHVMKNLRLLESQVKGEFEKIGKCVRLSSIVKH